MDNENEEMITISKARYEGLLEAESKLEALDAAPVDNCDADEWKRTLEQLWDLSH